MKRDMELIRALLLDLEDGGSRVQQCAEGGMPFTSEQIRYHAYLIADAGLATGADCSHSGCRWPQYVLNSLTWEGHEFLDAARDNKRWRKAMTICDGATGVVMSVLKEVLISLLKQQVLGA